MSLLEAIGIYQQRNKNSKNTTLIMDYIFFTLLGLKSQTELEYMVRTISLWIHWMCNMERTTHFIVQDAYNFGDTPYFANY